MSRHGYLLDTNILSYLAYPLDNLYRQRVQKKLALLGTDTLFFVSAISWGEIEYGWRSSSQQRMREQDRKELERFFPVKVTKETGEAYAEIKIRLFEKFAPHERRRKDRRVEQLKDPLTGLALGVDENDVWITAQAIEHKLILVSHDKMHNIREVANQAGLIGFEDWAEYEG